MVGGIGNERTFLPAQPAVSATAVEPHLPAQEAVPDAAERARRRDMAENIGGSHALVDSNRKAPLEEKIMKDLNESAINE